MESQMVVVKIVELTCDCLIWDTNPNAYSKQGETGFTKMRVYFNPTRGPLATFQRVEVDRLRGCVVRVGDF